MQIEYQISTANEKERNSEINRFALSMADRERKGELFTIHAHTFRYM